MRNKATVAFHFLITPDERQALRLAALKRGVPASDLVRAAIKRHMRGLSSEAPQRERRAAG